MRMGKPEEKATIHVIKIFVYSAKFEGKNPAV